MFRTELDLELKKQTKSGSPFFNLRESILIILKYCSDKPKVCTYLPLTREKSVVFSVVPHLKNLCSYLRTQCLTHLAREWGPLSCGADVEHFLISIIQVITVTLSEFSQLSETIWWIHNLDFMRCFI